MPAVSTPLPAAFSFLHLLADAFCLGRLAAFVGGQHREQDVSHVS
jgi:hypothetical protein